MGIWSNLTFRREPGYSANSNPYAKGSIQNFNNLNKWGTPSEQQGLQNLYDMLLGKGRVDPRLLASAQAQNARLTQQGQSAVRARGAASGMSGSGLNQALMAAIGAAGADRSANLNYQDIADSYARNQQNVGLMGQLVMQPQLGYASLSADLYKSKSDADARQRAAEMAAIGSSMEAVGSAFGGCWVAEAIFGVDSPDTHLARFYVNNMAPDELHDSYMENGKELAGLVASDARLKENLRPIFLSFSKAAERILVE